MSAEQGYQNRERGFVIQNQPSHTYVGWNTEIQNPQPYNPYFQNDNVIITQPSVGVISSYPPIENQIPLDCLPGLEYLAVIDQLLICQQIEVLELLTGYETENKYQIKNTLGQPVFFAAEDSGCCARCWCGTIRPLNVVILDNYEREVLNFERPLKCQSCLFPCCLQEIEVKSPLTGEVIGLIEQNWTLVRPSLSMKTPQDDTVLKIRGPLLTCSCCCQDIVFDILTVHKKEEIIGTITKQWSGFCKEAFTDADNFSITFPADLDVKVKATLLAAVFLIDYMYYEETADNDKLCNITASNICCSLLGAI